MVTLGFRAVVYDRPALIGVPGGSFREYIAPGSLTKVLAKTPDVVAVRDHDQRLLIGRTRSGTLQLEDRPLGLEARVSLPATALGAETAELAHRGDLAGASFRFRVGRDSWFEDSDGVPTRVVERIDELIDVSPCVWPAYEQTSVWLTSEKGGTPHHAAAARRRTLDLVEHDLAWSMARRVASERRYGYAIPRPSWAPTRKFVQRHGCGHREGGVSQ